MYHAALDADRYGHHCARLRRESGSEMRRLLSRYGEAWTDRWSWFMTCVLTWRLQGKSLADEVSKIA